MYDYLFTVFTPTYNRKEELKDVYNCLLEQTFSDFEWLIIDDGSTDKTYLLVEKWINENKLNIHYVLKENGGKHTAHNRGVQEAKGELFLTLDSDDTCTNNALEIFANEWFNIEENIRDQFSGITCLAKNHQGKIVGEKFKNVPLDDYPINVLPYAKGEKWGFHRTEVLKKYLFPEFKNEKFIAESLIWNRMGQKYKVRYINTALRYYEAIEGGLTQNNISIRIKSPRGTFLYYSEAMMLPLRYAFKIRNAANLIRFSWHSNSKLKAYRILFLKPLLYPSIPLGYLLYIRDRIK